MKSDSTYNLLSVSRDKAKFVDLHCLLYCNNSEYLCRSFSDNKKGMGHMVSLKLWGAVHSRHGPTLTQSKWPLAGGGGNVLPHNLYSIYVCGTLKGMVFKKFSLG